METSHVGPSDPRDEKQNTAVGVLGTSNPENVSMLH